MKLEETHGVEKKRANKQTEKNGVKIAEMSHSSLFESSVAAAKS